MGMGGSISGSIILLLQKVSLWLKGLIYMHEIEKRISGDFFLVFFFFFFAFFCVCVILNLLLSHYKSNIKNFFSFFFS